MSRPNFALFWNHAEWINEAHAWIRQTLDASGYAVTGPIEQFHVRIWSTVMRVPTDCGTFYFKACHAATEPRITAYLGAMFPKNIPALLAVDLERGWMLMRDAGPMLRTYLKSPEDLVMMEPAMALFAHLQIAVAQQPEVFLTMGARDHRLDRLPGLFEMMLADTEILRLRKEDGIHPDQYEALQATLPHYQDMCQRLQTYRVPQTLHHDDFHDGNIFVSGDAGSYQFVFSDWDESCVTHPFYSMMLCLRSVGGRAGFPDEATEAPELMPKELNHLRDIYLSPWQCFEDHKTLIDIFNLAWRVGMVSRALSWRAFVSSLDKRSQTHFTHIVPAWLQEFLLAMK
jgi:hypothetical protein